MNEYNELIEEYNKYKTELAEYEKQKYHYENKIEEYANNVSKQIQSLQSKGVDMSSITSIFAESDGELDLTNIETTKKLLNAVYGLYNEYIVTAREALQNR